MSSQEKITQFRQMVERDPQDELAQFSLGQAYLESGNPKEAGPCFQRVLALNGQNSKAFALLGLSQKQCGQNDLAIQTLRNGYLAAHRRGDLQPMKEMAALLTELGAEPPAVGEKRTVGGSPGGAGTSEGFACSRCGAGGPRLESRPFKGPLGERILASVCANCWKEWVGMGTKVINELRLPMYDPQAQATYDHHMKEFLALD